MDAALPEGPCGWAPRGAHRRSARVRRAGPFPGTPSTPRRLGGSAAQRRPQRPGAPLPRTPPRPPGPLRPADLAPCPPVPPEHREGRGETPPQDQALGSLSPESGEQGRGFGAPGRRAGAACSLGLAAHARPPHTHR